MPAKVLLAHAKTFDRTDTELTLQSLGWEVTATTSFKTTCELVEKYQYQFILLSISLDEGDAFAVTKLIREREGPVRKSLIVGATRGATTEERCLESGMDGVINLECQHDELAAQLQKWAARLAFRMWKTEGMPRLTLDRMWTGGP